MKVVEAINISTRFEDKLIHDKLNFFVNENEIFGILGGSGAGKSVLLRQMLALDECQSGEYIILGKNLNKITEDESLKLKQSWGVVFQFGALFSFFTVFENIALPLREYTKLSELSIKELVYMKLKMSGLDESVASLYPSELSGGMVKRVAIARALVLDSKLLFLDEPTSGLDPQSSREFDELILSLKEGLNLSIVMVTHDKESMRNTLDRFLILQNRQIAFMGTHEELLKQDKELYNKFMG